MTSVCIYLYQVLCSPPRWHTDASRAVDQCVEKVPTLTKVSWNSILLGIAVHMHTPALSNLCRACDHLQCLQCDFRVSMFDEFAWDGTTDYLFLRNNVPDFIKLRPKLVSKPGCKYSLTRTTVLLWCNTFYCHVAKGLRCSGFGCYLITALMCVMQHKLWMFIVSQALITGVQQGCWMVERLTLKHAQKKSTMPTLVLHWLPVSAIFALLSWSNKRYRWRHLTFGTKQPHGQTSTLC